MKEFDLLKSYRTVNKRDFNKAYDMFESPKFDKKYFLKLCDSFRSPHIWYKENDKWFLRKQIS